MQSVDYIKYCLENKPMGKDIIAKLIVSPSNMKDDDCILSLWSHYRIGCKDEEGNSHQRVRFMRKDSFTVALHDIGEHMANLEGNSQSPLSNKISGLITHWKRSNVHTISFAEFQETFKNV
jgi:hypothetical protein